MFRVSQSRYEPNADSARCIRMHDTDETCNVKRKAGMLSGTPPTVAFEFQQSTIDRA